jgi:alpha-beta hydrolase superfamily lysophospholipase
MSKLNLLFLLTSHLFLNFPEEAHSKISAETPKVISATQNSEAPLHLLKAFTTGMGQKKIASLLKYGVKSYTLVYQTSWKGEIINASGLVLVPAGIKEPAAVLSIQHGTTFLKDEAPSASGGYTGMELFASAGYIVFMPDYLGYGTSSQLFHPYYDKKHSATSVIDMIKSGKQFLSKEKIPFNDKLFLAGYSEGGFVTLAAAEEIERNPSHQLKLNAIAAGAGGYDLSQMLKSVTTESYYSFPAYLAFVLMSYNKTYDWNKSLEYFFKDRYADALNKYMNGKYGPGTINSHLTTNVSALLNTNFYAQLKKSEGEMQLKRALKNNTVAGWKTQTPIRLYHGTKDEIIPYRNSEVTFTSFQTAGSDNVTLTSIPGGNHGTSFFPMLESVVNWLVIQK